MRTTWLALALLSACSDGTVHQRPDPILPAEAFDACGGKIVGPGGVIDPVEYQKQALAWDRATIDCRLGTSFAAAYPGLEQLAQALYVRQGQHPETRGHVGGDHHACSHGFAVQPFGVSRRGLDRVSEGVAQVQQRAIARLPLITPHHVGLELAGAIDCMREGRVLQSQQPVDVGFDPVQE